ncbi:hypothetical protein FAF44_30975, partial [Nonomuraea sp. MG754425]|uniref:hypothetical protein n=1 Tax=Nonomuraea sp. MG754425 TaxID=2570319 RepID=UPI001F3EE07C
MLLSQAGRRLVHTTSALGLMGTLVVFVCSLFIVSTPATASAAAPKTFAYTCDGGPFTNTSLSVSLSAPDSVAAGQSFALTVNIPALTLQTAPTTATTAQATLTLTPTGGTISDTAAKTLGQVAAGATSVTPGTITYQVAVTAGTTTNVTIKPSTLTLALASAATTLTSCSTTSTEVLTVPIGTGGGGGDGTGTDLVQYECTGPAATDIQDVEIKVELTMPTSAKIGEQFAIKWKGTYTAGKELKAPATGQTVAARLFAYASLTGITGLTSATGEGVTGAVTAGQIITLPTATIDLKTTASTAGTATVKPAAVNFGANTATGTTPAIECEVQNTTALKEYRFTVGNGTGTPTPTPTPT